jgi:hypothetical protein
MNHKRIYILGAGSSIGHSRGIFPSITKFFDMAKQLRLNSRGRFNKLENYVQNIMGKSIFDRRTKINIEDLFTHIEIEIERKSSWELSSWELLEIRQQLFEIIQDVLLILESKLHDSTSELNNFQGMLSQSDTIITFNWDLLLDNILKRETYLTDGNLKIGTAPYDQYVNFILGLSALGEMTLAGSSIRKPYNVWKGERGYYLKAHGSIDWFYCSNEGCRGFHKVFPLSDPISFHYCSECHERLDSLLIPPILNKGYRRYPLIRRIWNLAAKELSSVNELIIWGYSLPPTDFYSFWLIRQSRQSSNLSVNIINPEVLTKLKGEYRMNVKFVRKFYNIFRGKISKESISLYYSFGDYIAGKDIFKGYNLYTEKEFSRI